MERYPPTSIHKMKKTEWIRLREKVGMEVNEIVLYIMQ